MDKTTHQVRHAQWTRIIEACNQRPFGMTAKQGIADNNISERRIISGNEKSGMLLQIHHRFRCVAMKLPLQKS